MSVVNVDFRPPAPKPEAGLYTWDISTNIIYADAGMADLFGLDPAATIRGLPLQRYFERVHDQDRPTLAKAIRRILEVDEPFQESYRVVGARGQISQVMDFGRAFQDPSGKPCLYAGMVVPAPTGPQPDSSLLWLCICAHDQAQSEGRLQVAARLREAILDLGHEPDQCRNGPLPTYSRATDVELAAKTFDARIRSLGRAHDLLTHGSWESASLDRIVREALSPYLAERLEIGGPDTAVSPKLVVAMSMILHELSTNAAKYGALSVETGRVRVSWSIIDGASPKLLLDWDEIGGPLVTPPSRKGFGTRLIEGLLSGELGGSVRSDYSPSGLRCHIEAALDTDWASEPAKQDRVDALSG